MIAGLGSVVVDIEGTNAVYQRAFMAIVVTFFSISDYFPLVNSSFFPYLPRGLINYQKHT